MKESDLVSGHGHRKGAEVIHKCVPWAPEKRKERLVWACTKDSAMENDLGDVCGCIFLT